MGVEGINRFKNWRQPDFDEDGWTRYGWRCQYREGLKLGYGCDIGCFTYINAKYGVVIGKDVQIGSHCSIYSENTENGTKGKVVIGDGALIGSHCLILPGVVIEPDAKVRAFSVCIGEIKITT